MMVIKCINIYLTHLEYSLGNNTDGMFFSGGSDSKLLVWHDATQSEETKRLDEAEQGLLVEQQLQNDIRNKRYDRVSTTLCILFVFCILYFIFYEKIA